MTPQEVNRLIDLYMEGKTSLEEERQLAIEVNRPDAPAEWKIIAEMLGELMLGEALYDQTMAERKRVRIHRYIGWSIAAIAACLTLWFVLGRFSIPTLQQETAPQIAQKPAPVVKPEVPEEKEVPTVQTPASLAVEQVAYNTPTKRIKKHHRHTRPVVEEEEQEEVPFLPEVSEEELAQVERNYQMWQLEQAFLVEQLELDAAMAALNKEYKEYLAEARNMIEI
jgi:hypothetical protein